MRPIGTLATPDDAQRFGDYLLSIGMRNHIEPARDGGYLVWIEHDDHVEQGQLQLRQFLANPADPRYEEARDAAQRQRVLDHQSAQRRRRNFTDVRTSWSGARVRPTPVSITIIVICVLVAIVTKVGISLGIGGMSADHGPAGFSDRVLEALLFQSPEWAIRTYMAAHEHATPMTMFSAIAHGQVWRLFTPMFLHFSLMHLIFNMSWVLGLGRLIEFRKGSGFLIALVLIAALITNCAEALWTLVSFHPDSQIPFAYVPFGGFSGVNYALFGFAWMKGRYQPYELIGVGPQTTGLMLTWLVLCMTGALGPVANAAHVAGLIVGVLAGAGPTWMRQMKARA